MTNTSDAIGIAVIGVVGVIVAGLALSFGFGGSNSSVSYEIQRDSVSSNGSANNSDAISNYSDYDSQRESDVSDIAKKDMDLNFEDDNNSVGGSRRRKKSKRTRTKRIRKKGSYKKHRANKTK